MSALLLSVFTASFLGSLHCAGMCGPLVGAYVGSSGAGPVGAGHRAGAHALYHLARLATLLLIGAIAGALGTGVDLLGEQAGLQRSVAVLAGVLMIVWGVGAIARGRIDPAHLPGWARGLQAWAARLMGRAGGEARPLRRAATVGALTPLLPCGWLYLNVVAAAGTGDPLAGAAVLTAFWAGNVPALLGVGVGLQTVLRGLRPKLPALSGAVLIVLGAALLFQRGKVYAAPRAPAAPQAPSVDAQQSLPCCHGS